MSGILSHDPPVGKRNQIQGRTHRDIYAAALEAAVEDPHRFSKASKLAAYGGFSPIVDSSGDEEENAKRRGGLHKPLDGEGRQEVKFLFTEAGTKTEEVTSCRERRAPGSLVGLRAQESKRTTRASPQPPSGELVPLSENGKFDILYNVFLEK